MDKFFYNVPLEYDKKALQYACENMRSWPYYSTDAGKTDIKASYDVLWPSNIEAYRIKNMLLASTNWSLAFIPPKYETGWHTDATRGATLIVPIDNTPHLIKFRDDVKEYEFYYSTPILTNANYIHNGINYTDKNRYNLLFHFDEKYESLCKRVDNNTLINNWIIYNNYYVDIDIDMSNFIKTNCAKQDADFIITDKEITHPEKTIFIGKTDIDVYSKLIISDNTNHYDIFTMIKTICESPTRIKKVEM